MKRTKINKLTIASISKAISIAMVITGISLLFGCEDKNQTSHPNEGGINLTVDWSKTGISPPVTYAVTVINSQSGRARTFFGEGSTSLLLVEPGESMIYVCHTYFSEADNVKIYSGNGSEVICTYASSIFTEAGKDVNHTAVMTRQTGELKLSLAIKPAEMISKIKTITAAVMGGVYQVLDLKTNEYRFSPNGSSYDNIVIYSFTKSSYFLTGSVQTFGIDPTAKQKLVLEIELTDGQTRREEFNISSLLSGFNQSKNTVCTLTSDVNVLENYDRPVFYFGEWKRSAEHGYLSLSTPEIGLKNAASNATVDIATNQSSWTYAIEQTGGWLTATQANNRLSLSATANTAGETREATVTVSAGGMKESVQIVQSDSFKDKEVLKLHSATVGKGVNLVLMGDGYTLKDMDKRTGKYEKDMRKAVDFFFSVYPFSKYMDHFNIYMIAAISNQEGVSNRYENKTVDNRFKSIMAGGDRGDLPNSYVSCDNDIVVEYIDAIPQLASADIQDLTVIMLINANEFAATSRIFRDDRFDWANGFSINQCATMEINSTYKTDFRGALRHETAGHGFAKLADEYINYPNTTYPESMKNQTKSYQNYGWYSNIDFFSDIRQTSWSGFANLPKYDMVGTFEGADYYGKGVWRPEYFSMMDATYVAWDDDELVYKSYYYFNAPSRWAIVKRIKKLAGLNYTFEQFLKDDEIPVRPPLTPRSAQASPSGTSPERFKEVLRPHVEPEIHDIREIRRAR